MRGESKRQTDRRGVLETSRSVQMKAGVVWATPGAWYSSEDLRAALRTLSARPQKSGSPNCTGSQP